MFKRGEIVMVNFNPTKGHEQGYYRPALVMNEVPLPGNLNIVLPITTKAKTYPLEVALDQRTKTQGVVLCFQIRTVDLIHRDAKYIEDAPRDLVDLCSDYVSRAVNALNSKS